ncbi:hypothetical protein LENED_003376 [Lentinula edodes]|uniref:Uncharacterized protein n=1 Tax=Lentinula edodes TaxID=5353 RepID=A0A1Q3E3E9_LENED|nr:hypothetical protein LENED_003376 [Lentinula edodes]
MPFIHNKQLYSASNNTRQIEEHTHTQESVDLMSPTFLLPQAQPTQINNKDIALITLMAIFILLIGAAAIRLAHLLKHSSFNFLKYTSSIFLHQVYRVR